MLTDFGLSKAVTKHEMTNTFCGTSEYLAPEVLLSKDYSKSVDWWSLGSLLYEMLVGITPFWADQPVEMYNRVLGSPLEFPADLDVHARDLVARLLDRDPNKRIGSHSTSQLMTHPFFSSVDWDKMMVQKIPAPFVPPTVRTMESEGTSIHGLDIETYEMYNVSLSIRRRTSRIAAILKASSLNNRC